MKRVQTNLATLVEKDGTDKLPTGWLNTVEPKTACHCTEERLFQAVHLLPKEEVDDILKKEEQIEARCQFFGKVYHMEPDKVADHFANAKGDHSKDGDMN
eukprot:5758608-Ditylum_brightwellii.AAC.1